MATSFAAQVSSWAAGTKERTKRVFQSSAQRVANEVRTTVREGGNLPIKDGNLRRSLLASTTAMPSVKVGQVEFPENDAEVELTINGADLGQTLFLGFQAEYARRMNYGFVGQDKLGRTYNQEGFHFVEDVAARWQRIVSEEAALLQGRVAGAFRRP